MNKNQVVNDLCKEKSIIFCVNLVFYNLLQQIKTVLCFDAVTQTCSKFKFPAIRCFQDLLLNFSVGPLYF